MLGGSSPPARTKMKVGDLVITKLDSRVGCIVEIKKQPWAGLCAKVLMFDVGTTKWKKIDNIRPLDKAERRGYNGRRFKTKVD